MADSVFVAGADGRFAATELARGPWDPQAQHGGAPAALLVRAFEQLPDSGQLALARVTYEFLRPVPLGELEVEARTVRAGRRAQLLEGAIRTADGAEVVRARALRVRPAEAASATEASIAVPSPADGRAGDFRRGEGAMFATDAMEIRFVSGAFYELGPATAWFRLIRPLVAGEEPSPLQRLAAAGDFGNGISAVVPWDGHVFINPDLTLYIEREPVGEWICVDAETRVARDGIGIAESKLYDARGRVGCALQALLVAPR